MADSEWKERAGQIFGCRSHDNLNSWLSIPMPAALLEPHPARLPKFDALVQGLDLKRASRRKPQSNTAAAITTISGLVTRSVIGRAHPDLGRLSWTRTN
jgi:hypothetical protein